MKTLDIDINECIPICIQVNDLKTTITYVIYYISFLPTYSFNIFIQTKLIVCVILRYVNV